MDFLKNLEEELRQTDELLTIIDKLLDSAQPNLEGKIRIKFWDARANAKRQDPFIVQRTEKLENFPKVISDKNLVKRAKSTGLFSHNYSATYQLLDSAATLLSYRKRLKKAICEFESKARGMLNGNKNRLSIVNKKITVLDESIYNNLKSRDLLGYYKPINKRF